jgi:oligoribonuclease
MTPFFWIDLEMTGLDEAVHAILEVALVITDTDFKSLEEYHQVVFQPPETLALMDNWCQSQHGASGLTKAVAKGKSLAEVEQELLNIVEKHYDAKEQVVLCGNSVGNDKRFLDKYMPTLAKRLHYRIIDVSSFKEVLRNKYGLVHEKKNTHRALDDIYESITELKSYLSHFQHTTS